jgi:hypothetical protein
MQNSQNPQNPSPSFHATYMSSVYDKSEIGESYSDLKMQIMDLVIMDIIIKL